MRIATRALSCFLAASLCCLPNPAFASLDQSSPIIDATMENQNDTADDAQGGYDDAKNAEASNSDRDSSASPGSESEEPNTMDEADVTENAADEKPSSHGNAITAKDVKEAGSEDPNPPQLISASVNKSVLNVGDILTISYDIADVDGINSVSLILINPKGNVTVRTTTGEFATQRTSTKIMSTDESGTYQVIGYRVIDGKGFVSSIISSQYEDKSGWTDGIFGKTFFSNIPVLTYQIKASTDPNPPQFVSASIPRTVCKTGESVNIVCDISEEDGISSTTIVLLDPSGGIILRQGIRASDGKIISTVITPDDKSGLYKAIGFRVIDKTGYVSSFIDEAYKRFTTWTSTTYGTCSFMSLPNLSFLVADNSKVDSYHITEGAKPTIEKGANGGHTFRIDGDIDDFVVATVNGADIPSSAYDLESGSTIITLKPAYLNTLPSGSNEFAAWYADGGNATTTMEVLGNDEEPAANSNPVEENTAANYANSEIPNDDSVAATLLQSGDKATLCIALGLLALGAVFSVLGATTFIRKGLTKPMHTKR